MKRVAEDLGKLGLLWAVLAAGQVAAGAMLFGGMRAFPDDGPVGTYPAVLIVAFADALILTLLVRSMRLRGWAAGLVLGGTLFLVQTGLSLIEAIMFNNDLHLSLAVLGTTGIGAAIRDALGGAAIAMMWRGPSEAQYRGRGLIWKMPVGAVFYVFCYFAAGGLIAWQSPAVRAFYAHVGQIDLGHLAALQIGRGLIWCALAWLLVRSLSGPSWKAASLVGLAFAGLMVPELLFPNPAMPWPVRSVHMVEIGVSNFLFGLIIALVLRRGAADRAAPGKSETGLAVERAPRTRRSR